MTGRTPGAALLGAYSSASNSPRALLELTCPGADLRGLTADGVGVILDPRGGEFAERSPSFSCSRGADGAALFSRKGGDGGGWNALSWLEQYGNGGAGMTRREAAALLIERAGIVDSGPPSGGPSFRPPRLRPGADLRAKQSGGGKLAPDPLAALTGWALLRAEEGSGAAWAALRDDRLLPALASGLLRAYRWQGGKGGRLSRRVSPDALALEIRGPEGKAVAVKFRNPGSKADLEAAGRDRYVYPKGHGGTPAWCTPDLTAPQVAAELWAEGERNGAAFALGLEAAGLSGSVGVQGMAGAEGSPHVRHDLTGRQVYVYADPDAAGNRARERWAQVAADLGAVPYLLPALRNGEPDWDAAAFLGEQGPEALGAWLAERLRDAAPWPDPDAGGDAEGSAWGEGFTAWPYGVRQGQTVKLKREQDAEDGEEVRPLLGFSARIVAEVSRDAGDGAPRRVFSIEGQTPEGRPLPAVEVPASEFSGMTWPLKEWGADGFVYPGASVKDEARAALLTLSRAAGMERRTVYTHTGWIHLPEHGPVFLTAGACIGAAGAVPDLGVSLPGKLAHYALPEPPEGDAEREAVRASLALLELGPDAVTVPMLGAVYRAPLGAVRFTEWIQARTGWGKSTLARLCQAHYGAGWIAHFPPAAWASTDNFLTRKAFMAKDVLFVVDDFKPEGPASDVAKAHAALSRFLGSAGDGAGRGRMSSDGVSVRADYYPRGLVLATAETGPRKLSDLARTVFVEVPGSLLGTRERSGAFYAAQRTAEQGTYAAALSGFLRWIAARHADLTGEALERRLEDTSRLFPAPHGRTPRNSAEVAEGWRAFLTYARDVGAVTDAEGEAVWARVVSALRTVAEGQGEQLSDADPVTRFLSLLSGLLRTGAVYLRDAENGEAPRDYAEACGWRWRPYGDPEQGEGRWELQRPHAVPVGYLGAVNGEPMALLEGDVYREVNRAAEGEGYALPAPKPLWKQVRDRLKPAGLMVCEKDRATYPRRVHGCGPRERVQLYNISWPIPLETGTHGTPILETPSSTAKSGVPFLFSLTGHIEEKRDTFPVLSVSDNENRCPVSPSAETAEQDAGTPEQAPGMEVFTV